MPFEEIAVKMRQHWDARAGENACYYIVDSNSDGSETEFYALGQKTLADDILNDMYNVWRGKDSRDMRVLEIGCDAGPRRRASGRLRLRGDAFQFGLIS